jgi:hypothetical protein
LLSTVQVVCLAPVSSTGQIALTHTSASGCPVTSDLVQLVVFAPPAPVTVVSGESYCQAEAVVMAGIFTLSGGLRSGEGLSYQADGFTDCIVATEGGK